jgi:tungstate transport system ATP-binding protein
MTSIPLYRLSKASRELSPEFSLRIDDWQHSSGQTLCLVGPTGAGKTTFLKMLTGLISLQTGSIDFEGRAWPKGLAPLNDSRRIVMVPQRPLLLSQTVRANLEYGLRLRGLRADDVVEELLHRLGLEALAAKSALELSGGQVQLVAIARALVVRPTVLLLDEPTANLDPACVAMVERILEEWRHRHQATFIWATHNMFQARRAADRVALLLNGQMVEISSRDDFFERPADPRTQDFVNGKMVY